MSDAELRDQLMTLLMAGHETTATGLAWAFDLLFRAPRQLERLRAELAEGGHEYLDAVIEETLRLRPVVPFVGRELRVPAELGGYELPEGTVVMPSIYLAHTRQDSYPDPHAFRPERFLDGGPGDVQLDSLRRWHPPLHRRRLRPAGDARRPAHACSAGPSSARPPVAPSRSCVATSPCRRETELRRSWSSGARQPSRCRPADPLIPGRRAGRRRSHGRADVEQRGVWAWRADPAAPHLRGRGPLAAACLVRPPRRNPLGGDASATTPMPRRAPSHTGWRGGSTRGLGGLAEGVAAPARGTEQLRDPRLPRSLPATGPPAPLLLPAVRSGCDA